jgi:hypothetical protein
VLCVLVVRAPVYVKLSESEAIILVLLKLFCGCQAKTL